MSMLICSPTYDLAWQRIATCHRSGQSTEGPRHLRLLGQPGVGKTFLLEQYAGDHPRVEALDRITVPVLVVSIPSAPTLKGLYHAILNALGVRVVDGHNLESLRFRVVTLIRNLGVELLLLDEINHLLDRGRRRSHEAVTDGLKQLIDSIEVPTVFAGAVRSKQLFDTNAQLRSRVTATHTMLPFDLGARFQELRGFVATWLQGSHPPSQCKWMSSPDLATRIFYATDGMPRQLVQFLDAVPVWTAAEAVSPAAFFDVLAQLFRDTLWESAPQSLNPFSEAFVYRRLDRRTEPYAATDLDGDNHLGSK